MSFYAVRRGRKPGIYESWDAAKEQVDGFANAEHKKFESKRDARKYISALTNVKNVPQKRHATRSEGSNKKRRRTTDKDSYYAVRIGRRPGIYRTWAETEEQVRGYAKAEYRKFSSEEDAQTYLSGPTEVPESMTKSDSESHMDERASYSQPTIERDVESSRASAENIKKEPMTTLLSNPKSESATSDSIPDAAPSKGWGGLKEHRTVFEEKMPTPAIISKLHAVGLLLEYEYAELKGEMNCPIKNRKLIDFLLCKDPELVKVFKKVLSDIPGYNHLVQLL